MEETDLKKWKTLQSKRILDHPRMKVHEDTVRLPNGEITDYIHIPEDYGAATLFAINSEGKILLQKEYSYPPNEILLQMPGGGIKKGEAPILAAKRELSEEANLQGDLTEIGWFYVDNRRKSAKMYVFVATDLTKKQGAKDLEEELEDYWLSEPEIEDLIRKNQFPTYSGLAAWAIYKNHKASM